jgi:phosphate transport system substrate-binding protein
MSDDSRSTGVSRRKFLAAGASAATVAAAGCSQENSDGGDGSGGDGGGGSLSGQITLTGSSTVFPISEAMAEEFKKQHPDVRLSVDSTGSGGGFENHFCPGNSDLNAASRPITDSEMEKCTSNGVEPVEFRIAADALTVAVNNEADWVDCMTFDELAQIWQEDGAERWSDVRDDWPDREFELFGPNTTSGTFDWFTENVVGEAGDHRSDYEPTEQDNLIVQGIEGSEAGMGYFGYAYYKENSDRVKAVSIKESEDGTCTPPSLENAKDDSYPMARPLFIYPAKGAIQEKRQVAEFVEFYLEKAETDLVKQIGYVPASESLRDENLNRLEEIRSE